MSAQSPLADKLDTLFIRLRLGNLSNTSLKRLTGGANQETWAFDAMDRANAAPLILRRLSDATLPKETVIPECDALLIRRSAEYGMPTATVHHSRTARQSWAGFHIHAYRRRSSGAPHFVGCGVRRLAPMPRFPVRRYPRADPCGATELPALRTRFAAEQLDELLSNNEASGS